MFILDDEGTLTMVKPGTAKYTQLDQVKVIKDGADAWGPISDCKWISDIKRF